MKYFASKYTFTYAATTLDQAFMIFAMVSFWIIVSYQNEGAPGLLYFHMFMSVIVLYLVWLFIVTRNPQTLMFDEKGITIPSTWLPGIKERHVDWRDIRDIGYGVKNRLAVIYLYLDGEKIEHLYLKAIGASYHERRVTRADEKVYMYLSQVLDPTDSEGVLKH